MCIRVTVKWVEVYEGVVYERVVYEGVVYEIVVYLISCLGRPISFESMRHCRVIFLGERLCSAPKVIFIRIKMSVTICTPVLGK